MKWKTDLIKDIRSGKSDYDNIEWCLVDTSDVWPEVREDSSLDKFTYHSGIECSECNINALTEQFLKIKDNCQSILEIGIGRNGKRSFAYVFINNKKDETKYVGIDIEDRSWLINEGENIYTIQNNSSNYEENVKIFKTMGIDKFDFIFIDGYHSVNQVLDDWEYSSLLNEGGIIGFHDTTYHSGPYLFIKNINKDKWNVIENACLDDYGIGFVTKK